MSYLNSALDLASKGFYVFPLWPNSKTPVIDDFPTQASRDPDQLRKWWLDPVLELEQPYNVGISTTKYNGSQALVVVDVDNKGKKKGSDQLLKLELEGKEFYETATQVTPTGGLHLIYRTKEPVKQGTNVLGDGLDIRSKGGYIVADGSTIDGRAYSFKLGHMQVEECPEWIVQACGRAIEKETFEVDTSKINREAAVKRAVDYLENHSALAIQGEGGDQVTFKVAAKLKDFGLSKLDALLVLQDHWNDRCVPPWSATELKTKIENAYSYSQEPVGSKSPEAEFTKIETIKDESYLQDMNKEFAVLFSEGEHTILYETVDEKSRPKRLYLKESTFRRKFSTRTIQQGRGPAKTFADVWLDWSGRREYAGLCFCPELEPENNYYNLWRGFVYKQTEYGQATPSARMGFDMFIDHARNNVCNGEEKLFQWLMGYFAHLIQKPFERPLTTLVFRGSKGVGKNSLVERIGKLLGNGHFLVAHNSRYLTSNFNGHLDSCLTLVLDEAFWSGDKSSESILKGLTTAPEIMIERKGKEPYMVDNFVRLVVIGNEDWLVPASADERRYAVFDVGEKRKKDQEFFKQMHTLMDHKGGAEILMHYLKNFDLKTVNVNDAPSTKGLNDQKMDSLSLFERFWLQCLTDGHIVHADFSHKWEVDVSKNIFREAFFTYAKKTGEKNWTTSETKIGRLVKTVCPSTSTEQKQRVEERTINIYRFPDLKRARYEWDKRMGFESRWNDLEDAQ